MVFHDAGHTLCTPGNEGYPLPLAALANTLTPGCVMAVISGEGCRMTAARGDFPRRQRYGEMKKVAFIDLFVTRFGLSGVKLFLSGLCSCGEPRTAFEPR